MRATETALRGGGDLRGRILKILSDAFCVSLDNGEVIRAKARGIMKLGEELFVGDCVEVDETGKVPLIVSRYDRKNALTRPNVANVDAVIIVTSPVPATDYIVVDKIIVNAKREGIEPIVCFNKSDLATDAEKERTINGYKGVAPLFFTSAKTGEGISEITAFIAGKTVCFAGISAVGKSSLINSVLGLGLKVGEVSKKWRRGKNTTRHAEAFEVCGATVIDTCGFSVLELMDVDYRELKDYYDEYVSIAAGCRFSDCNHISEPDCAVIAAVEAGRLNLDRYLRYKAIYEELKRKRKAMYD